MTWARFFKREVPIGAVVLRRIVDPLGKWAFGNRIDGSRSYSNNFDFC